MSIMVTVQPEEARTRFIRNPAMGWVVYADCFEKPLPAAEDYWASQEPNINYASIFYIRVPWSQLEPEEGKYAWLYDDNFKQLIRMALERGLKLAFRVYVDSKDAYRQATPQFVFDAGARGYVNETKDAEPFQTPFVFEEIFQQKLASFVEAFALEYDDPQRVDFIDGQGLGWWGEMHNLDYLNKKQKKAVFEWLIKLYSRCFSKVLLGLQYGKGSFSYALQEWALREYGYMIRRDSFGSPIWLKAKDKKKIANCWPIPVFAENCYHTFVGRPDWYTGDGFLSLLDMLGRVIADAEELRANTLDLRIPEDAGQWMKHAPELVERFAITCGYRFVPIEVRYNQQIERGESIVLQHSWRNVGNGLLPNHLRNWNYKYKLAFALLDFTTYEPEHQFIVEEAELSSWLSGTDYYYENELIVSEAAAGRYCLAAGIINTAEDFRAEIELALPVDVIKNKWWVIGPVKILE